MESPTTQSCPLGDLDDEMAALTLQLQEVELFSTSQKGKNSIKEPSNVDVACTAFHEILRLGLQMTADLQCARSIAEAVSTDDNVIAEIVRKENQDARDRHLALQMSGQNTNDDAPPSYVELVLDVETTDTEVNIKLYTYNG
jgi:hypothetical protein